MTVPQLPDIPAVGHRWDRPRQRAVGDPDPDAIYLAVGKALTLWEASVEGAFASLFGVFMQSRETAARRVYGTITTVGGKIEALNQAAQTSFLERNVSPATEASWQLLSKHYRKAADRRNDIAHSMIVNVQEDGTSLDYYLMPPLHITRRYQHPVLPHLERHAAGIGSAAYQYVAEDVDGIAASFHQLGWWGFQFSLFYQFSTSFTEHPTAG